MSDFDPSSLHATKWIGKEDYGRLIPTEIDLDNPIWCRGCVAQGKSISDVAHDCDPSGVIELPDRTVIIRGMSTEGVRRLKRFHGVPD